MLPDPWLTRWLPLVIEYAQHHPVLEIGCGSGDDTATLAAAGLTVHAFDLSESSVALTRIRVPQAFVECRDTRDQFPIAPNTAGVVVASLTLHYFPWQQTVELFERVRQTLRPGGVFLCRLNSTEDRNFGAVGHSIIEDNYYMVDGQPKRFFDERAVHNLFSSGWRVLSKEHLQTRKYVQKKALWEVIAMRSGA
jgi:SAM-dependent methyltransferase